MPALAAAAEADRVGEQVGPYHIEALIGRGGMGVVYRARRTDGAFEQTVAIKFLRSGLAGAELIDHFARERALLATLDHPGIVTLLDAGVHADGTPYLIMSYVDGQPITAYCREHGLLVRERVRLVIAVCEALSHAHRHLIVHRDIKPGNILITRDGKPKLLDFGIGKLLAAGGESDRTMTALQPMTPEYASPEQLLGRPITTATDVYGMGLVLYELLTDRRPFSAASTASPLELARTICETQPPRPSTAVLRPADGADGPGVPDPRRWSRELRGDLDAIVTQALSKKPERRYARIEQLAEDLRRWLDGRAVRARRGNVIYRLRKTLARHKAATVMATVAIMALLGGSLRTAYEAWHAARRRDAARRAEARARQEAQRARREAQVARRVTDFLVDLFKAADSEHGQPDLTARDLLARGAERLTHALDDEPEVRAPLLEAVGWAYENLGQHDQALRGRVLRSAPRAGAAARTARSGRVARAVVRGRPADGPDHGRHGPGARGGATGGRGRPAAGGGPPSAGRAGQPGGGGA